MYYILIEHKFNRTSSRHYTPSSMQTLVKMTLQEMDNIYCAEFLYGLTLFMNLNLAQNLN